MEKLGNISLNTDNKRISEIREAGKLGSWEAGKLGSWEAGKLDRHSRPPTIVPSKRR
jgi:hypothetical protein